MSAYTNGLALWKHFEEKQGAIITQGIQGLE